MALEKEAPELTEEITTLTNKILKSIGDNSPQVALSALALALSKLLLVCNDNNCEKAFEEFKTVGIPIIYSTIKMVAAAPNPLILMKTN
jgi:hypothetical protein